MKEHSINQRFRKEQEIFEAAAVARSSIQRRARQYRAISSQPSQKILGSNGPTSTMKTEAKEEKSKISEATPAVYYSSTSRLPLSGNIISFFFLLCDDHYCLSTDNGLLPSIIFSCFT